MTKTFLVSITAPDGTNLAGLLQDILDIGWDCLHDRGGDPGWQETHPNIFDRSPDHVVNERVSASVLSELTSPEGE